jgi:hypothetical protein
MNRLRLILLQVLSICISQLRLLSITTPRKPVLLTFDISLFLLGFLDYFPDCIVLSEREYSVFDGFIRVDSLFISKYCSTISVLFEVVFYSSFISCPTFNIDVSSAYIIDLPFVRCGISFIYIQ